MGAISRNIDMLGCPVEGPAGLTLQLGHGAAKPAAPFKTAVDGRQSRAGVPMAVPRTAHVCGVRLPLTGSWG
jgi:hypothetical protein